MGQGDKGQCRSDDPEEELGQMEQILNCTVMPLLRVI